MPATLSSGIVLPVRRPRLATVAAAITAVVILAAAPHVAGAQGCSPGSSGCAAPRMSPSSAPVHVSASPDSVAADEATVDAGRKLFHGRGTCFTCHGASLEGSAIAPTLREHPWKDAKGGSLDAIYQIVTHGVPGPVMVSHPGGISDADARRLAAYIWAVSHGTARP